MHLRRVLVLAVALLAAFGLTASLAAAPSQAAAKRSHNVSERGSEIRNSGTFHIYGRAYTAPRKIIQLQRQNCRRCPWRKIKQTRAGAGGRFELRFDGPRGSCYRIFIPAGARYRAYAGDRGCIVAR